MKKTSLWQRLICVLFLVTIFSASACALTQTQKEIRVYLGQEPLVFDSKPILLEGRIMVPLRSVFSALNAQVTWDQEKKTIVSQTENFHLSMTLNQQTAYLNGQPVVLEIPPFIINQRVMVPLRFVSEAFNRQITWDQNTSTAYIINQSIGVVGSYEKLKNLLAQSEENYSAPYRTMLEDAELKEAAANEEAGSSSADGAADYSSTNLQVQGVDEADIVKTDGKYIYQISRNQVMVSLAYPAENMLLIKKVTFADKQFYPQELYIDDKFMVVIGSSTEQLSANTLKQAESSMIYPPYPIRNFVKCFVFSIKNKNDIRQIREIDLEGSYLTSRKIGSRLYLISNSYFNYFEVQNDPDIPLPAYRDTAAGTDLEAVTYDKLYYFPGQINPNYLLVAGLDLAEPDRKMSLSTYLGSGENVYATSEHLYIAANRYQYRAVPMIEGFAAESKIPQSQTGIYKFKLTSDGVKYLSEGTVPGRILNQFSMDEYDSHFRIATTTGESWFFDESTSKNNIYLMDQDMKITGKIEDIAPGERIYSARFIGKRGYLVTFKNVDPLFVVDLADPTAPQILGALKIPGYSEYLHPYDENHLIGFGKDTIEVSQKDWTGSETGTMAFYQGLKIALFDVTDVSHPVQMFQEVIGDRGTDSELLRNHKALLFSREKNLLAFPVTLMEIKNQTSQDTSFPAYGEFTFQGAYVYRLDLENGFSLKGRISHLSAEDLLKSGSSWYDSTLNINRILYLDDNLYTVSQGMIKANRLTDLKEIKELVIPQ